MSYKIVLTPPSGDKYIGESEKLFADREPYSMLSKNSLPHITIAQFESKTEINAKHVWNHFVNKIQEGPARAQYETCKIFKPFSPTFTGVTFREGKGKCAGITWVQLSIAIDIVDKDVFNPKLKDYTFLNIREAAQSAISNSYEKKINDNSHEPHQPGLTLGACKFGEEEPIKMWSKDICEKPKKKFELGLGQCDEKGQLTTLLETFKKR